MASSKSDQVINQKHNYENVKNAKIIKILSLSLSLSICLPKIVSESKKAQHVYFFIDGDALAVWSFVGDDGSLRALQILTRHVLIRTCAVEFVRITLVNIAAQHFELQTRT